MYTMVKTVNRLTTMLDNLTMMDKKESPVKPSKSDPTKSLMSKFKKLDVTVDRKIQKQSQKQQKRQSKTMKKKTPRASLRTTRHTEDSLVKSLSNIAFGSKKRKRRRSRRSRRSKRR